MKINKVIAIALTVATVGLIACQPQNNPDGPGTKTNDTDTGTDTGTETPIDNPDSQGGDGILSVEEAIAAQNGQEAVVEGYIVGWYNNHKNSSTVEFSNQATADTTVNKANIVIAASPDVQDVNNVLCVQLPAGKIRAFINLGENPNNLGKKVQLTGKLQTYNGLPGMKETSKALLEGVDVSTLTVSELTCYRVKIGDLTADVAGALQENDVVVVKTQLINWHGDTPETSNGTFVNINGDIPADAITATQAIEICNATDATTDNKNPVLAEDGKEYIVYGTVTAVTENAASTYKNMTFKIK